MPINADTVNFIAFHPEACRFHLTERFENEQMHYGYTIYANTYTPLLEVTPIYTDIETRITRMKETLLLIATLAEYEYYQGKNGEFVRLNLELIERRFC